MLRLCGFWRDGVTVAAAIHDRTYKVTSPASSSRVSHNGDRVSTAVLMSVSIWFFEIMIKHVVHIYKNNNLIYVYGDWWSNTDDFYNDKSTLIARFMRPTLGPSGADKNQVGPMLIPWTLPSGISSRIDWPLNFTYPTTLLVFSALLRQDVLSVLIMACHLMLKYGSVNSGRLKQMLLSWLRPEGHVF